MSTTSFLSNKHRSLIFLRLAATSEGNALKAASGSTSSPISPVTAQPPTMRGYLSKWTNMARGYRSRWFVLDNGERNFFPYSNSRLISEFLFLF